MLDATSISSSQHSSINGQSDKAANDTVSSTKAFIEANTVEATFEEMTDSHIIPVFIKDNEPVISHTEFIEAMVYEVKQVYHAETILNPSIRVSHPIKGRIPEAKYKPATALLD